MRSNVTTVSTILDDPEKASRAVKAEAEEKQHRRAVKRRNTRASNKRAPVRTPEQSFLDSVGEHRMTVLRDDGLYRHVRFAAPGTSMYRFDLVTWPGHLVITGDLQDYHFTRLDDMFQFFRDNPDRPGLRINPDYWSEKLVGGRGRQVAEQYSFEAFKESLVDHFLWTRDSIPEGMRAQVWRSIKEEILDDYEVQASKEYAYKAAAEYQFTHYQPGGKREVLFQFNEVYEWRFTEWDWHFLVSLNAIVWGIQQWDAQPHKTQADWLREDLAETRKNLREQALANDQLRIQLRDLESMHQDLINDVVPPR